MSEEWEVKTLGSLCDFVRGPFGGSLKKSCFKTSGYAVYEQQHAIYDQFEDIRYFIDESKYREMKRFELFPGDLLMSCSGTMGKVAIVPDGIPKGIINQALLKLSPRKDILAEFLKYWMNSPNFQNELIKLSLGVAIKNVASVKVLKEIEISLPLLPEQKRIVAILDEAFEGIDRAIANTEKNLANSRELFESYLNDIFIQKGDEWEEKKLGDIATFRNGLNFTKTSKGESIKIVGVKDFQNHFWIQEDKLDSVTIDAELKEIDILRKGDILTVRSNGNKDLIKQTAQSWTISNIAAILLAKKLDAFSPALARKAPRVVIYEGINKLKTRNDNTGNRGYAVGFGRLVDFVYSAAPQNRFIEEVVREEVKMFPEQALRELIANALVHQDFLATGTSVMIEMYSDRIEISNPGIPPIKVERFIDENRSRNEQLADIMRRFGICEEKGSGIDKVVSAAEDFQLPAPDFRVGDTRTTAVLFAHQDFAGMSKTDRIRACYQHCCLLYVSNQRMSNQTLRERFRLSDSQVATVSLIIGATKEAGLIKADESESTSTRYARYLPFWA